VIMWPQREYAVPSTRCEETDVDERGKRVIEEPLAHEKLTAGHHALAAVRGHFSRGRIPRPAGHRPFRVRLYPRLIVSVGTVETEPPSPVSGWIAVLTS
jgi:hypothetical protein